MMDGAGSGSSRYSISNPHESGDSLDQTSSSLSFMSQHDLSTRMSSTTNSVSLVVTPVSGIIAGTADNITITHRIDEKLHFDVKVSGFPPQGTFIRIPFTRSVKRGVPATGLSQCLNLIFELRGAETGRIHEFACQRCKNKISRDLGFLSRVDFTEKQDLIALENGKARISFRFMCYPGHDDDGTGVSTDKEYIIQAVLKDHLQVAIARFEIPNRFKIARFNGPAENRGKTRGSGHSPSSQERPFQVGGLLGSTAPVPVTAPLGANPLVLQSFAHHRTPGSHMVPLRPSNVAENPTPLPSYPVLHNPYGHIHGYAPEVTSIDMGLTGTHSSGAVGLSGMPRYPIGVETRSADIVVRRDNRPSGVLENESRANETLSQRRPQDLQVPPGIYNMPPPGTSSSTTQQPLQVPHPTAFIGVVSNRSTGNREDTTQAPTEEALRTISPYQLYHPHQPGTALAPTRYTGVAFPARSGIPTMPLGSVSSSAATILPSTTWYPNVRDHGTRRSSSQQGTTQEPTSSAEYVAPSKGPMSGGVEVTIIGSNFPHTLPLSVYFSTKAAVITRKTRETIRCLVPAISSPGPVDVCILVGPPQSVPVIDCRMAKFTYEDTRTTDLMMHVKYVASQGRPGLCEVAPTSTMQRTSRNPEPGVSKDLQPLHHNQFEETAMQILDSYSMHYDWGKAVSRPNEYGQTLAHLAVALGYTRLLEQLISWKIDLSVRDATGATALHFACRFDRPDCVSLLTRNGANQQIEPDESDASSNGTLNQSSDLASEHAGCITDREETLGAERDPVPKWLREENEFDPRRAKLLEFGANSTGLANLDSNPGPPNPGPPTTGPTETGAIGTQLPGATSHQSIGMTASHIGGVSDAWTNAGPPNPQRAISLGNGVHPETSHSHINTSKNPLWTSGHLDTLSTGVSGTSIPFGALWSQNQSPTSARIEESDRTTDEAFPKEVVPTKGGGIQHQTATLPVTNMSSPSDQWHSFRELENLEAGATIFTPQGSSPQILPFETPSTGTPNPASPPIPITSPALPASISTKKPFGDSLQSFLGTNQSDPPDAHDPHPIDLAHGGLVLPKLPPPQPYEFREMTLGCRFVATDQWLTTRVDTTWTISQVKLHMLTKLFGARRDQLKALDHPGESHTGTTHSAAIHENRTIATSNRSPVIFGLQESSEFHLLSYSPKPLDQLPPRLVDRGPVDGNADIPSLSSFIQSVPTIHQTQFDPRTDTVHHLPSLDLVAAAPPATTNLNQNKVNKEDVLDELLDRLETDAKERVHKEADKYCLIRFLYGNMLDDSMTLTEYRLRPFELLEMQEKSRFLQVPRRVYLDMYWESPVEVQTRDKNEVQGADGAKKLVRMEREVKVQQELQRDFMAEFMSNPVDEASEEPKGAAALMLLPWKNTPEASAREHAKRRRKVLQKVEQVETKRQQREIEETETGRWVERLVIIEGQQLNVWKHREDDYPEQSWDLRTVVEVSGPKKQPELPPGSVAAAYAALKSSNALNIIPVESRQKVNMEEQAKANRPHLELHIQFSIPLSSANEALYPTGAAARFKREVKKMIRPSILGRPSSSDPFNQGIGASTIQGSGSATLVLRLPDERSLENLSRVIHRSVGRYPLNPKPKPAQEVTHADTVDARATKQENRFHPYPEWRERMLQKCIASGRYGVLTSPARKAKPRLDTGVYELPRELQELLENEEVDAQPETMMSDAEWEGWRRELESPRSDLQDPLFVTESVALLGHKRREDTPVSGSGKGLEGILKWTTEHSVHTHPHFLPRGQPSRALTSSPVYPSAGAFVDNCVDRPASSGSRPRPTARCPSPPSNSAPPSPRQFFSVPNHARSATLATSTVAPGPPSHYTNDASYGPATPLPNPPDAPIDGRLPGLGGGLGSYQPHTQIVTTISTRRSADNEAAPKKGTARVWSNKGTRRSKTEEKSTSEEATVERPPSAVDYHSDTWTRSHIEGLDRLRHMPSSGLRQTSSKGGLLKSFTSRDR